MKRVSLDQDWRFHLERAGERPFRAVSYKNQEAEAYASRAFNAEAWRKVDLPHDWAVELPYNPLGNSSEGHKYTSAVRSDTLDPAAPVKGEPARVGWYRKTFFVPKEAEAGRVYVEFDGAYRDSRVWINGQYVDAHESGYTPFCYELTDNLYYGEENALAVRVDAEQPEGWWYEGAGIYRHVRLLYAQSLHLALNSVYARADAEGRFHVEGRACNEREADCAFEARLTLIDPEGREAASLAQSLEAKAFGEADFAFDGQIERAALWSVDEPKLYEVKVALFEQGEKRDEHALRTGFRSFVFDSQKGFFLNGQFLKLKGVCMHQDFAGVGVALPDSLHEYKIRRLKEMGANAYRTSHHAPAPEILDACDRLGMLVMDETRMFGSTPEALRELEALVLRDRSHACVCLWSLGNEEHSVQSTPVGARLARTAMRRVRALDPSRAITYGGNNGGAYEGVNEVVDVRGVNYVNINNKEFVDEYHAAHPHQCLVGSEEDSIVYARGEYTRSTRYAPAYGEDAMPWASSAEGWWKYYLQRPFLAGGFMWTGFDYRGEPSPYYRNASSSFGVIDLCGYPKDPYYGFQAWWTDKTVLHLLPHWNWTAGESVRVCAFGNVEEVALRLNGREIARSEMPETGHLDWNVTFEPGTLEAVGYRGGAEAARDHRETAGAPARVRLTAEFVGEDGVALATAELLDESGRVADTANTELCFEVEGGKLLGVCNGDPASEEPEQFLPEPRKIEICEWTREEDGKTEPWNAFAPSAGARYALSKPACVPEKSLIGGMTRFVYKAVKPRREAVLTARWQSRGEAVNRLYFPRLEGNYVVSLNGEELGRGNALGYECAFAASPKSGENVIEIRLWDDEHAGGVYEGAYWLGEAPANWRHRAFNGKCLAVLRISERGATLRASAEGLEGASVTLSPEQAGGLLTAR